VGGDRWNSNLHSFEHLMRAIPVDAHCGLDVGCGEGETTRRLRRRLTSVVGVDVDPASIETARSHGDDIDYVLGDFAVVDLPEESFDVVSAVAVLHHVDLREGLTRLAALVRPGGVLLVVGLARSRSVSDLARDGRDAVSIRRHTFTKDVWETPSPKLWPPPLTYSQARNAARSVLPTATFERIGYFRYGLTWVRAPAASTRQLDTGGAATSWPPGTLGAVQPDPFVPAGFEPPTSLRTEQFRLEPLGPQHNAADLAAWTSSIEHIRSTAGFPDGTWPPLTGMTAEENLRDLRRHADDFAGRAGFTFTVLDPSDDVIGCVYLYPSASAEYDVTVQSWVRADRSELDASLSESVASWLARDWPWERVDRCGR
jgi:SAM-dependent methyltransferase